MMEWRRCPGCGSTYFTSSQETGGIVFQVDHSMKCFSCTDQELPEEFNASTDGVCCGACSWCGDFSDLLDSFD